MSVDDIDIYAVDSDDEPTEKPVVEFVDPVVIEDSFYKGLKYKPADIFLDIVHRANIILKPDQLMRLEIWQSKIDNRKS